MTFMSILRQTPPMTTLLQCLSSADSSEAENSGMSSCGGGVGMGSRCWVLSLGAPRLPFGVW